VDPESTGETLRQRVQEALGHEPSQQLQLFFQNGSRNAVKVPLDEAQTLAAQGVENDASITVKDVDQVVAAEDSALRKSIAKNGGQSYYYAHANENQLPPEVRYVSGGEPIKLTSEQTSQNAAAAEAPAKADAKVLAKYSWADEGDFVCVYISAENEPEAIAAAGDGKGGEVQVTFDARSVELRITGAKVFALTLKDLEKDILPDDSKHRVSAGKRITLKMRKKRGGCWTRLQSK